MYAVALKATVGVHHQQLACQESKDEGFHSVNRHVECYMTLPSRTDFSVSQHAEESESPTSRLRIGPMVGACQSLEAVERGRGAGGSGE